MTKPTLVLIPGFGANEKGWQHQIAHLAGVAEIQVIVMDNQATRQEMVDHLLKIAPSEFLLAGQSMGGWVAQAAAAAAPERVTKLLLLNTWCRPDPQLNQLQMQVVQALKLGQVKAVLEEHIPLVVHPARLADKELIDGMRAMIESFPPQVLARQMEAMLSDYASLHLLPQIKSPTFILHGRQDALFSDQEQHCLLSGIKGSKLAIIEECGHAAPVERPQAVTALMRYFIEY